MVQKFASLLSYLAYLTYTCLSLLFFFFPPFGFAFDSGVNAKLTQAEKTASSSQQDLAQLEKQLQDIPEEELSDLSDAMQSKQYLQRTLLYTVIQDTSQFDFQKFYFSHFMGYSATLQKTTTSRFRYSTGFQGLAIGYIFPHGHGVEISTELSAVSNLSIGYRLFLRPKDFSIWPILGIGIGKQISYQFVDPPPITEEYTGATNFVFTSLAILIPLVDLGIKGEVRFNFYGTDRICFVYGVGLVVFL